MPKDLENWFTSLAEKLIDRFGTVEEALSHVAKEADALFDSFLNEHEKRYTNKLKEATEAYYAQVLSLLRFNHWTCISDEKDFDKQLEQTFADIRKVLKLFCFGSPPPAHAPVEMAERDDMVYRAWLQHRDDEGYTDDYLASLLKDQLQEKGEGIKVSRSQVYNIRTRQRLREVNRLKGILRWLFETAPDESP